MADIIIRRLKFELEKAEHGLAMPYDVNDVERVWQLRKMLQEARKRKLSVGLKARREGKGGRGDESDP
jgi:hypothetical protein